MEAFEMSRAVGGFDVFFAPMNDIGVFDTSTFLECVKKSLSLGRVHIGLDLSGVFSLNSGIYNCLAESLTHIAAHRGELALIADSDDMEHALKKYSALFRIKVFRSEAELLTYSIQAMFGLPSKQQNKDDESTAFVGEHLKNNQDVETSKIKPLKDVQTSFKEHVESDFLQDDSEKSSFLHVLVPMLFGIVALILLYFLR